MPFVDWLRNNTQGVTEAARQVLYMLLGFEVLRNTRGEPWTDAQVGIVMAALSSILTLIAAKTNVAAPKVQARMEEARAKGVIEGVQQAESGTSR
jgi:hypothetical protein